MFNPRDYDLFYCIHSIASSYLFRLTQRARKSLKQFDRDWEKVWVQ